MKNFICLIFLLFFNFSFSSNLFFKWRITDTEHDQFKKEALSLFSSNGELFKQFISNYKTRNMKYKYQNNNPKSEESANDEPNLMLSRYTHCQKCLYFVKSFRQLKEKYGFKVLYENIKKIGCNILDTKILAKDACHAYLDNYIEVIIEGVFSKYFDSYFLCEKIDLCSVTIPKKYIDPDDYAKNVLKGKPNTQKEKVNPKGKKIKMLQITDLHVDMIYKEGATAVCKYPICCRDLPTEDDLKNKVDLCGKYGYEGKADLSEEVFDSFIEDVSTKDVDFIIWTGDNGPHDLWAADQELLYNISELIKDKVDKVFRNENRKIPIYYCLGNHEKFPNDNFLDNNEKVLLQKYADIYKDYLSNEAYEDFKNYGYYSMKHDNSNLRIISLNCFLCDTFNFNLFNSTKASIKRMLTWLQNELQNAEKNKEFVYIINHFPINGEFSLSECGQRFQALFDRYEYNIRGIFSGHTHRDDIVGVNEYFNKDKIIHLNFVAPQLTTYEYKLPSYRIYTIDEETKQVLDYEQFRFNLTKSNEERKPYWYSAYNASTLYKVNNMLDYKNIINFEDMGEYVFNQYSGSKVGEKNRNDPDKLKAGKCVMTTNNFDEYFQCYSPEIGLRYEYLNLISNFIIGPFEED